MYRNATRVDQGFVSNGASIIVPPGFLLDERFHPDLKKFPRAFTPFVSFAEFLDDAGDKPCNAAMIRMYAMGDVVMLYQVCRLLAKQHPSLNIDIYTAARFTEAFRYSEPQTRIRVYEYRGVVRDKKYDVGIGLDGCLELDHRNLPWFKKHRMALYLEFLGFR